MDRVKKLRDPQSEMLLLRNCSGVSKLYFTLRTTDPRAIQNAASFYDKHLMQYLQNIIVGDGAGFGPLQRLAALPIKDGGLGVYTMKDTGHHCFLASSVQTRHLQNSILQQPSVLDTSPRYQHALQTFIQTCGINITFDINDAAPQFMKKLAVIYFGVGKENLPTGYSLTHCDTTLWLSNRLPHAMDFLKAIPIQGLNQFIGPR